MVDSCNAELWAIVHEYIMGLLMRINALQSQCTNNVLTEYGLEK